MKSKLLLLTTGLVISAFSFGQTVQRTPLYETFTSSTCPPCKPGNEHLEGLLDQPVNEGKFTSLKYQMSWPGTGDPYYTNEGGNRRSFYAVSSVPRLCLDGGFDASPTGLSQTDMDAAYAIPAVVELDSYFQIDEASQTVDVQIIVTALEELASSGGLFLHCAIFEKKTTGNIKSNGETEFEHVMKKMLPSSGGTYVGGMDADEVKEFEMSYTFNGDYVLPPNADDPVNHAVEHSVEEFSDLGVVVWLQRSSTREVYQSMYAKDGVLSIYDTELTTTKTELTVYPNPADQQAKVVYALPASVNTGQIVITDFTGKIIRNLTVASTTDSHQTFAFDTHDLANGIYFVSLSTNDGKLTKKLSVMH